MQLWHSRFDIEKLDKIAPCIFLVLLLWICWRLANIFWWVVVPPQAPVIQSVVLGSQKPIMPNIVRFSIFEEQGQAPQAQQQDLPIKLEGVVLANPQYLSSAVLRIDNQANRYRVGEQIAETGMQLAAVYWDRVMIRQNGVEREVKFGEQTSTANIAAPEYNLSGLNAVQNKAPVNNPDTSSHNTGAAIGGAIEQLQKDRAQYLNQMGVSASGNGFEITDKTPPALRARLGLQPGDKVVSVNGQNITAGTNEAQLLEQIRKTGQAKIEIQRGDRTMTIQQNF